jgi:two-component system, chemotaxis family, sensor histidine kinase and response regulator WspE
VSDDLSGFSLYELFRTEAESQTAILNEGILALEQSGNSPSAIEPLMRAAHSLKGAARIVGMIAAERLAHALEEVFVAAQKGTRVLNSSHVDVLLASVDLLGEVSRIAEGSVETWLTQHGARLEGQIATLLAIESGTWIAPEAQRSTSTPPATTRSNAALPEMPSPVTDTPPSESELTPAAPLAEEKRAPSPEQPRPADTSAAINQVATPDSGLVPGDRAVRVTAENLNRLMGLAGESLVQARQLRPLVDALKQLKEEQTQLWDRLQALDHDLTGLPQAVAEHPRERLVAAKHQVIHSLELLGRRMERLEDHARRGEDLSERLHHEVISSRLRPLIDGVRGFSRLVRDTARQLGIQARFEIVGEQTGVDRDILEKLEAPLNHLIRNALDHGVELPEKRRAAGKNPQATIRLEARHVAGMLQVRLSDDGHGIDPERVRTKVIDRGMAPAAMAAKMTEAELFEFLFLPGFSTKSEVTSLSGRGVGLDVVQSMVQSVGGSVRLNSQLGAGTCFTLQLPITMSVIRALIVHIAGQPYAFPLSRLESIQRVEASAVETLEGRPFFTLDGETVGLVPATQVLDLPQVPSTVQPLAVAILSDRGSRFGVVVDEFLGERDLDVRPTDPRLGKVPNISTASVLEDGWPVLIIDVEDLVRSIDNLLHGRRFKLTDATASTTTTRPTKRVLVVDDSITVRELERQLLESRGYAVDVAVDGMDGWNAVRSVQYDLVVSDVAMPRMDGIQLVSQIKSDARLRALPVIIVSYKDREDDRIRGLDAGASSYLTKSSFHDQGFLDTVADLIGEAIE